MKFKKCLKDISFPCLSSLQWHSNQIDNISVEVVDNISKIVENLNASAFQLSKHMPW